MIDELKKIIDKAVNSPSDLNYNDLNFLIDVTESFYSKLKTIKNITKACDNNKSSEKYTIETIKEILKDLEI